MQGEKINRGKCRALLSDDTPFAAAIGLCMLSSLLLPNTVTKDEEAESYSGITTTDTRFAVMGVISFIPYFNWLVSVSLSLILYFLFVFGIWMLIKFWSSVVLLAELGFCLAWYWEKKICYLFSCLPGSLFEVCFLYFLLVL